MQEEPFLIQLPCFHLWCPAANKPAASEHEGHEVVPIFTDEDSVRSFIAKEGNLFAIAVLVDQAALSNFLGKFDADDYVVFDPVDSELRFVSGYRIGEFLNAITTGR